MKNVMIVIEYDGTNYSGWQVQPNAPTIQEEIMKALKRLTGKNITIHGSGRTDAGVHAKGQVATFMLNSSIPIERIPVALNSQLPDDIAITYAREMPFDFHARYSVIGKRYGYCIYHHPYRSPLLRNYSYHVRYPMDYDRMKKAAQLLVGTHDFKGFMASGSNIKDTIRTIHYIDMVKEENSLWIRIEGNGFLYNMVRIIVGTLVEIGKDKMNEKQIIEVLKSGDRKLAAHTAPAQGLYLERVFYPLTR